jgi:hypothetical protein
MPIAREKERSPGIGRLDRSLNQASRKSVDVLSWKFDREISHGDFTWRKYTDLSEFQGTSNMLRITVTENESEQRWVLQGRLTGSFLEELTASWCATRDRPPTQSRTVDLNEVTCIDKDGEQVLLMMIRDGAKFVASGLYTKHLLESLSKNTAGSSNRQ